MRDLSAERRFYAEEVQMTSNLQSPSLVDALASVPRERFLPPGPWTVRGEADFQSGPRQTRDADPRHVYHNIGIAIDPARTLFNGAPGLLAMAIDRLGLRMADRVLHLGTATGYYTALIADCVGPTGQVVGLEVDPSLAGTARELLADRPWVSVVQGNGSARLTPTFDAMLINAGVTHPLDAWLDALGPGGRMILPVTATLPGMATIGKGLLLLITRSTADPTRFAASVVTFVAIYSAVGLRDDGLNVAVGRALAANPYPRLRALRRDPHDPDQGCWLHLPTTCFSLDQA